jgi:hypothetical protein
MLIKKFLSASSLAKYHADVNASIVWVVIVVGRGTPCVIST